MGIEIKRRFLVNHDNLLVADAKKYIKQSYVCASPEKIVRVRTVDDTTAILTVKNRTETMTNLDYEWMIKYEEALEMFDKLCNGSIVKTRYIFIERDVTWEVDVFHGDNEGLIIAGVELKKENKKFNKPAWIGEEITNDTRYYNSNLITKPYKDWENNIWKIHYNDWKNLYKQHYKEWDALYTKYYEHQYTKDYYENPDYEHWGKLYREHHEEWDRLYGEHKEKEATKTDETKNK